MTQRLNYFQASTEAMNTLVNTEKYIARCHKEKRTLNKRLIELVKIRVSQINGCAYCIDMHSKDARAIQETEQRLYGLSAWRETNFYSDQERAALAWAEANTLVHVEGISDELYETASSCFNPEQLVDLTLVVTTINSWNRIALSFKPEPGSYDVGDFDF
ncbi:carboxymuconolactone decarboxylase [Marinomonas sp. 42_23_T18]|nr:carboxymuconolactone decarboxylase [Marinomonas sp. 42_23_T18]